MKNMFNKIIASVLAIGMLSAMSMTAFAATPRTSEGWGVSSYPVPGGYSSGTARVYNHTGSTRMVITCTSYSSSPNGGQSISFSSPHTSTVYIASEGQAYATIYNPAYQDQMAVSYYTGSNNRVVASGIVMA